MELIGVLWNGLKCLISEDGSYLTVIEGERPFDPSSSYGIISCTFNVWWWRYCDMVYLFSTQNVSIRLDAPLPLTHNYDLINTLQRLRRAVLFLVKRNRDTTGHYIGILFIQLDKYTHVYTGTWMLYPMSCWRVLRRGFPTAC